MKRCISRLLDFIKKVHLWLTSKEYVSKQKKRSLKIVSGRTIYRDSSKEITVLSDGRCQYKGGRYDSESIKSAGECAKERGTRGKEKNRKSRQIQ